MIWTFTYQNGEQYYNRIHLYFNGLIAVSLFPFAMVYLELDRGTANERLLSDTTSLTLSFGAPLLIAVLILFAFKGYRKKISKVAQLSSLRGKLDVYFESSMKKYLLLSAAALLTVLCLYGTYNAIFIVVYVFVLIAFSLGRPTLKMIGQDCQLDKDEMRILEDKLPIH